MEPELLKALLAGVPVPLVLVGADQRVLAANDAAARLFGVGIEGRNYVTVLRQPGLWNCVEAALRGAGVAQTRLSVMRVSGEMVYRVLASPVPAVQGQGVLVSFEDVTDLEQAGQIRRDFVANVSHELRTPLTALLGFIETLQGSARDDVVARDRFLGFMAREAERMNRLVSDLLSLSRVEAEERVRPTTQLDLVALVAGVVATLRGLALNQGVELELAGAKGPLMVMADADQLTQVFHNLIENAVKYGGAAKKVTIAISRADRDPELRAPAVLAEVIDRGDGIDPVHLPRLTERFYRVDSHRSREKGGTGLGLAIVKHIVNRHQGRLRITSETGQGSRFTVVLPEA